LLGAQRLAQPSPRVSLSHPVGFADWPETEVVAPPDHQMAEHLYRDLQGQEGLVPSAFAADRLAPAGHPLLPCGVPRPSSRLRVFRCPSPRPSVFSTLASLHILIRCSIAPSTNRQVTDLRSSACGMPHGKWSIRSASQLLRQFVQPSLYSVRLDALESPAVHSRCSAVGLAAFAGTSLSPPLQKFANVFLGQWGYRV